jgi:sugar/nucleoside kinase (ribokinase family)
MARYGLFVGLLTLDLIYLTTDVLRRNQKQVALDYTIAAGGPATNAAVTFRHLGDRATLLGVAGIHPMTQFALTELQHQQVRVVDLNPIHPDPIPTSSILVTQDTGERSIISLNATRAQAQLQYLPPDLLDDVEVVLIDGHQAQVGEAIARQAHAKGIPMVIDGGHWKPGFELVLPYTDYAICSHDFMPPNCHSSGDVVAYLKHLGVPHIAITHGSDAIEFYGSETAGTVDVPMIQAIDTLGAGDIFHGAFCHFSLRLPFAQALAEASKVATQSCQSFGTRQWMTARGWRTEAGQKTEGEALLR